MSSTAELFILFLILSLILNYSSSCRIDSNFHGVYKKESKNLMKEDFGGRRSIVYEDVSITSTAISNFGDCYQKYGSSYVFGLKRMGRSICFRCVTPIMLSSNIVHLAHQYDETCYDSENDAKMTCFDQTLVTISDGSLLFRNLDENAASCSPIDGKFDVAYRMNDAALSCEAGDGTHADNCASSSIISVQFRNCSFPDFDMSLRCIGSWRSKDQHYLIVQNEENEEYRCGLIYEESNVKKLYFANDSSCSSLTIKTAFDTYYFHTKSFAKPFAPCSFPVWMQGDFDTMRVTKNELQYVQQNVGAVPLISHCVQTFDDRVLVYSETKCGEPLGYHCLLFNARSQNLIEFKTTLPSESSNSSVCLNETQWNQVPWSSSVVLNTSPYPCGIQGFYTSDSQGSDFCYDVIFDCYDSTKFNISAYHCKDGLVFDSRSYTCLASWKEDEELLIYVNRENQEEKECFVSKIVDNKLLFSSTGEQCERNSNFDSTSKLNQIMKLTEKKSCRKVSKSRKQPKAQGLPQATVSPLDSLTTTFKVSVLSDEFWFSSTSSSSPSMFLIFQFTKIYFLLSIF